MKFGVRAKSWQDLKASLLSESNANTDWEAGLTLGMVLAHMHKVKSAPVAKPGDSRREATDKLVQPCRNKARHKR